MPTTPDIRTEEFTGLRPLLFATAYRMLGSAADADDVLQDAWLRYAAGPDRAAADPKAYLVKTVTRLCLDRLTSATARRVSYVGPWLPEPVLTEEHDPFAAVERRERLSLGAVALLERLSPAERAVFVLKDGLDYGHGEIAEAVGVTPEASRQLLVRARRRLADGPPRQDVGPAEHARLLAALQAAFATGELAGLLALLRADVALVSDGGGEVRAARRVVAGADKVARLLLALWADLDEAVAEVRPAEVNGLPGLLVRYGAGQVGVAALDVVDGLVSRVYWVSAPSKLGRVTSGEAASS